MGDDPADREWREKFDTCKFCGATGCVDGTAEHKDDCPSQTGVFPVDDDLLYEPGRPCEKCGHRNLSGAMCSRCGTPFERGDFYHHVLIGDADGTPIYESVCAGCAAQAELMEAPDGS